MLGTIDGILFEALPYALLALGLVLTIRYLRVIDLTFAASFAVAPAVAGALLLQGQIFPVAFAAGCAVTICLALSTLFLIRALDLDALLASLLTSFAGLSIALLFTQGTISLASVQTPIDSLKSFDFRWVQNGTPLHPAQISLFVFLVLFAKWLIDTFLRSEIGLVYRAMEDEQSRRTLLPSLGASYWRLLGGGLIAGNLLCAASGILVMLKEGQVSSNRGFDALLATIAAYLFGMTLFERRTHRTVRTGAIASTLSGLARFEPTTAAIFGAIFYFALLSLVLRLDVPSSTPKLIMVALVIAAFFASRWDDLRSDRSDRTRVLAASDDEFRAAHVSVSYPGYASPNIILNDVTLTLRLGEAILLTGPNGSGKSTLLKYLCGRVQGHGVLTVPTTNRRQSGRERRVGYISQDAHLGSVGGFTVNENLALFASARSRSIFRRWRTPADAAVPVSLSSGNMAHERPAQFLSGGQRQLLNIAAMLIRADAPKVVLFDEPLSHLDERAALYCVELIEELVRAGRAVLVVEHDIDAGANYPASPARTRLSHLFARTVTLEALEATAR